MNTQTPKAWPLSATSRALSLAAALALAAALTACQNDDLDEDNITEDTGVEMDYADRLVGHFETNTMLATAWVENGEIVKILTPCVIPNPLIAKGTGVNVPVKVDIEQLPTGSDYSLHLYYNATVATVDVKMQFRLERAAVPAKDGQPYPAMVKVQNAQISGISGSLLHKLNGADYTPYSGVYMPAVVGNANYDTLTVAFQATMDQMVQAANKQPSFSLIPKMVNDQIYKEMGATSPLTVTTKAMAQKFRMGAEASGDATQITMMNTLINLLGLESNDLNAVDLPMKPNIYNKYDSCLLVVNPITITDASDPRYIMQLIQNNTLPLKTVWEQMDVGIIIKIPVHERLSATPEKDSNPGANAGGTPPPNGGTPHPAAPSADGGAATTDGGATAAS